MIGAGRRAVGVALVAAVGLGGAGCGAGRTSTVASATASRPAPAADAHLVDARALPGLRSITRILDRRAVARATPLPGLEDALRGAGFAGARERELVGDDGPLRHVVSRSVDFSGAGGASSYAARLLAGADGYLGPGARRARFHARGVRAYVLRPLGCGCRPEAPELIALVASGPQVVWLSISGPGATMGRLRTLLMASSHPSS